MERLIEYYLTDDRFNVFVVAPGDPFPHAISLTYEYDGLSSLIAAMRQEMGPGERAQQLSAALSQILLGPLLEQSIIEDGDLLCLAPHRCLHEVPFCMLTSSSVAYVPSGWAVPPLLSSRPSATKDAVVVVHSQTSDGEELRASFRRESERVAAGLNAEVLDCTAGDAMDALASRLPGPRIVHFICHARHDDRRPDRSGLVLPDAQSRDRLVSADELSALDFTRTELVAFGGCETGRSAPHQTDDRRGLARAALSAGASTVLATLWPVESHTAEQVFPAFYEAWDAGNSRAASLRLAQDQVASTLVDPRHWAPYVLVGAWR